MAETVQKSPSGAEVRKLVALGLAVDSTDRYLQWHLAVSLGDSARRAFWTRPDLPDEVFSIITIFTSWTGIAASGTQWRADSGMTGLRSGTTVVPSSMCA